MSRALRTAAVALALLVSSGETAWGQPAAEKSASPGPAFPELPLRRNAPDPSGSGAIAWLAVALLAAIAGTLYWARRTPKLSVRPAGVSVSPARGLTAHASLHVIEWEGEQLLLACTAQSVVVLARRPHDPGAAKCDLQAS